MAGYTEDDVRSVIVGAVEGIGEALGFDRANGNVLPYLLEEEIPERYTDYLGADVGAQKVIRAWGFQVYGREDWLPAQSRQEGRRLYRIVIDGYYGVYGETPINLALTHARLVRKAIFDLNLNLSNRVDRLVSIGEPAIERLGVEDIPTEIFRVRMIGEAEEQNPGW